MPFEDAPKGVKAGLRLISGASKNKIRGLADKSGVASSVDGHRHRRAGRWCREQSLATHARQGMSGRSIINTVDNGLKKSMQNLSGYG